MKRPLRLLSALLALCVIAASFPIAGLAAGEGTTTLNDLIANAQDGATITLTEDISATSKIDEAPWIIEKNVIIEGNNHSINVCSTGILLGADVTFRNVKIDLTSTDSRNAIIANGYTLTLDNVKATNLAANIFCGTLLKAAHEETIFEVPEVGATSTVNILGKTNLQGPNTASLGTANIFAGSLAMGGLDGDHNRPEDDGQENTFPGDVTINIEDSADSAALGTIYAGGGQQRIPISLNSTKETTADPDKYKVGGTVTITGTNALPTVIGSGSGATDVIYKGDGDEATKNLQDISSLRVESGNLVLLSVSRLRDGQSLSVASDARLNLAPMTGVKNLEVQSFDGNGYLILGENQTWNIGGSVTGQTTVAIGSMRASGDGFVSNVTPKEGHTYIQASGSQDGNFILLPPANKPNMALVRDNSGNWTATDGSSGGDENLIASFRFLDKSISAAAGTEAEFKMEATLVNGNYEYLDNTMLSISIDGNKPLNVSVDPDEIYAYIYTDTLGEYYAYVGDNSLCITASADVRNGNHTIQMTLPSKVTDGGKILSDTATLTITGGSDTSDPDPGVATVTQISVSSTGHKTEYQIGENLDVTNLTIEVVYSDQTKQNIPVTEDMVSDFDSSQAVKGQVLTITYEGKLTSYTVDILAEQPSVTERQVTVENTGGGGTAPGSYPYAVGSTVVIRAGSRSGYTFAAWEARGIELSNWGSPELRFVMPDNDVSLRVIWQIGDSPAPEHSHTWSGSWTYSGTHHWHSCTADGCPITQDSEKNAYAPHTTGDWVVDRPASSTQSGSRHRACTVCGYVMAQESIPATGGSGGSSGGASGGGSSGGGSSGGGSSDSGSSSDDSPSYTGGGTKNPDGSTTTTSTNKSTGTVTQTTRHTDGSRTVVETQKGGTVTTTTTAKDGSTVKSVERPGGGVETTVARADGLTASVRADRDSAQAEVRLPAVQSGGAVALPIPTLPGENADITIHTSSPWPVQVQIPAQGSAASTVAYLVGPDGSAALVKTALLTGGQITVRVSDGVTVQLRDNSKRFDDTRGHWAEEAIHFVTARELFSGTAPETFSPNTPMTRAMLMTVLAQMDGADTSGPAYEKAMAWAVAQGVSDGQNPNGQATREQFVLMLYRYAGSPAVTDRALTFRDAAEVQDYAQDAVCWAVENGLLSGYGNGSIAPGDWTTRAQAAAMMKQYVDYLNRVNTR